MTTVKVILPVLSLLLLAAAPLGAQRRSDVITAEEIEKARATVGTAYDAVQSLRPRWLKPRDRILTGRPDDPVDVPKVRVYLDGRDQGDITYLRTIPAELVEELRYLSTNEAGSRFGPSEGPGIVVTLKS